GFAARLLPSGCAPPLLLAFAGARRACAALRRACAVRVRLSPAPRDSAHRAESLGWRPSPTFLAVPPWCSLPGEGYRLVRPFANAHERSRPPPPRLATPASRSKFRPHGDRADESRRAHHGNGVEDRGQAGRSHCRGPG